jgi:serine/threonine protein kinase/tetratricopeptide (TPR) repeat protein
MSSQPLDEAAIFNAAREMDAGDARLRYIDDACGGDRELRGRIEALLLIDQVDREFLERPAQGVSTRADSEITERPGGQIGPYTLVEAIGEGGFGKVFVAEQQQPVRRRVALKIIKPGMDTHQVVARFESERRALALMAHPNIAHLIDGGATPSGRPYFVMELVSGAPITEFCDKNQYSAPQRLELFVSVCRAVEHAHRKGIIHRDIKPSNVMVTEDDGTAVVKIIDFGVAKAIGVRLGEDSLFTADGQMVGTPAYMSPEQASMSRVDVDTRSDVYSLGVLLYELLTGTTPIEAARLRDAGYSEIERLIREVEPARPSTRLSALGDSASAVAVNRATDAKRLGRLLAGDLDWIVMKALEKAPDRRYGSPGSFADDVERYLRGEAVVARPPSTAYRLRKFAARHSVAVAAVAAVTFSLVCGTAIATWQAMRAKGAERTALLARDVAGARLRQAQRSEARAKSVLKFFQDKVLSAARPKGQEGGLRRDATVREALDRAEPEIATAFAGEPLVEASIRNTLGVSYWYLGDHDKSLRQQELALAIRRTELGPEHQETIGAMNDLALALDRLGKFAEEQKILEVVVAVRRRTLGPADPMTLKSANNLATVLAMQGELEDAAKLSKETLEHQRKVDGSESMSTLRSMYNLAIMSRHLGRWAEARPLFDESINTLRRVFSPDHQDTLRAVNGLGELLLDQRRPADACAYFEEAMKGQRTVLGPRNEETVYTMINLADAERLENHLGEARRLAEEADAINMQTLGPEHPQTLFGQTVLSSIARDEGRFEDARKGYEKALAALRRSLSAKTPEVQRCMDDYAWMLASTTDPSYADPRRAIELAKELIENSPKVRDVWTTLGVAHYRAGGWNDAIAALEKSDAAFPGVFTAANGFFLAMACSQVGEKEKGREWYERALLAVKTARQPTGRELALFQAEAAGVLGISSPKPHAKGGED